MLHTWLLICLATTPPADCSFDTSVRWFQTADQRSKTEKVVRVTNGLYIKVVQSLVGASLGTDSYIFYPCETPKAELEKGVRESGDAGLLQELDKGDCLR